MSKIRIMSVFGTRPEAIKMCPLVLELERRSEFETVVCVTGQHRQMLDQVMDVFKIKPDYDLNIMLPRQTITTITTITTAPAAAAAAAAPWNWQRAKSPCC